MGMLHDTELNTILERYRSMTPERLSAGLGVTMDTLYRAWKKQNPGASWARGVDLDNKGVDRIIEYYAGLGNHTAIRMMENRAAETSRKAAERVTENGGTQTKQAETGTDCQAQKTEHAERKARAPRFTVLDAVFLLILALTGWNVWFFLGKWGAAFWVAYAGVMIDALRMASRPDIQRTARAGLAVVCVLEFIAFWTHLAMANLLLVNAAKANLLPFRYEAWGTLEAPFYIALVVAAVLSGTAIYAVWVRISIANELGK